MAIRPSVPNSRIKGLMTEFQNLFNRRIKEDPDRERLKEIMTFVPSKNNARDETFHFFEDPPGFRRWDPESPRTNYGTLGDNSFTVPVLKWESSLEWRREDEEDDLTRRLRPQLQALTSKASLIEIESAFQIMQGLTDPDRLATIPTAADGLAMYSAARVLFGSAGNIYAGSGVGTTAQIKADFFGVRELLNGVTDTHGDLYHPDSVFDAGMVIVFNDEHLERFAEAFEARVIQGSAAGIENILVTSKFGANIQLWPTPRVTGDDWYVFLRGFPEKPLIALERTDLGGVELILRDETNSDYCAENDVRRLLARRRIGFGVSLPLGTVKVSQV